MQSFTLNVALKWIIHLAKWCIATQIAGFMCFFYNKYSYSQQIKWMILKAAAVTGDLP